MATGESLSTPRRSIGTIGVHTIATGPRLEGPLPIMAKAQRGIQSIEVGGRLLAVLVDAAKPLTLRDLAQKAGMTSAKAHPYLVSFGKLGLVEQDAVTGRYGLGPFALQSRLEIVVLLFSTE